MKTAKRLPQGAGIKLRPRMLAMLKSGLTTTEITQILNDEGIPISRSTVHFNTPYLPDNINYEIDTEINNDTNEGIET